MLDHPLVSDATRWFVYILKGHSMAQCCTVKPNWSRRASSAPRKFPDLRTCPEKYWIWISYQHLSTIINYHSSALLFLFPGVSGQPMLETAKWHRSASVLGAGGNPRLAGRAAAFWRATARVASGTSHVWRSVCSATGRRNPGNPGCKWGKYHSWKYV